MKRIDQYDQSQMVVYHYGQFPPTELGLERLIEPMLRAQNAVSRYDQMLLSLPNSKLFLAPLRHHEAVVSSRLEGTISNVDEVMMYAADEHGGQRKRGRSETIEVFLYSHAMRSAQAAVSEGRPISEGLIKNAHKVLLSFGHGAHKNPGEYKKDINFIGDDIQKILFFKPIEPWQLKPAMSSLFTFVEESTRPPFLKVAIAHAEFEALHPFNDGNGRIGRLLIPLLLWKFGLISQPHLYISDYFEIHKEAYLERLRAVSRDGDWTGWIEFFLNAVAYQAESNLAKMQKIADLYESMKDIFREVTGSKWHLAAQDCIFESPIFTNKQLIKKSGMARPVAVRITKKLCADNLLKEIRPGRGRRGALYRFTPLMEIVRA